MLAVLAAALPAYIKIYAIAGPSMSPSVLLGDKVVVNMASYDLRLPYLDFDVARISHPERGHLVIYDDPRGFPGLKRIIGLPGDEVEMKDNKVYLNGRIVEQTAKPTSLFDDVLESIDLGSPPVELGEVFAEERLEAKSYTITYTLGRSDKASFGPVTVPDDSYFILGDHRDNSGDSRFAFQGFVSRDQIKGRMILGERKFEAEK